MLIHAQEVADQKAAQKSGVTAASSLFMEPAGDTEVKPTEDPSAAEPDATNNSADDDSVGESVKRGHKWYKFFTRLFTATIETDGLNNEMEHDKTMQHIAMESILNHRVITAHPEFIEIYSLEDQNLILDAGRQAGKLMDVVPSPPGVSKFGTEVFNYYGQLRDNNNARIDVLIRQMFESQ
jgi:hypothetical protein